MSGVGAAPAAAPIRSASPLINGELKFASTGLSGSKGLLFSPDEKHLYVDDSE